MTKAQTGDLKSREFLDEARTLAQQLQDVESCRAHLQASVNWFNRTVEELGKLEQLREDLDRAAVQCYVARQRLEELERQAAHQMEQCRESEPQRKEPR